jgi:hypothetical protein
MRDGSKKSPLALKSRPSRIACVGELVNKADDGGTENGETEKRLSTIRWSPKRYLSEK